MSESGGGGFILSDRLRQAVRLQIDCVNGKDLLTGEIARSIAREGDTQFREDFWFIRLHYRSDES